MPVPVSPRWGLILFLLVLDVGLAGAGALLLQKGLSKPEATTEKIEPKAAPAKAAPAKAAGSAAPVTAPQPGLAASVNAIAQTAQTAQTAPAAPLADAAPAPAPSAQKKAALFGKAKGGSPEDPYDAKASLPGEIELASARSKEDLEKCQTSEPGTPHGRLDIAFTIERDGSVSRVNAANDTTGSATLAPCLISVIRQWTFASHPASSANFVRPFLYN